MVVVDDQSAQVLELEALVVGLAEVLDQSAQVLVLLTLAGAEVVDLTTTQTWLEVVTAAQASTGAAQVFQLASELEAGLTGAALVDQLAHEVTASGFLVVVVVEAQSAHELVEVLVTGLVEVLDHSTQVVGSAFLEVVVVELQSAQVLEVAAGLVVVVVVEDEAHGSQALSAVTAGVAIATPARAAAATNDFILSLGFV